MQDPLETCRSGIAEASRATEATRTPHTILELQDDDEFGHDDLDSVSQRRLHLEGTFQDGHQSGSIGAGQVELDAPFQQSTVRCGPQP
jgi:hypothetical protein